MTFCITLAHKGKFIEDDNFYIPFAFDEYSGLCILKFYLKIDAPNLATLTTLWIKVLRAKKKKYEI